MASTDEPLVDARELLTAIVEPFLDDLAGREVDGPAIQRGRSLVGAEPVLVEHTRVAHHVEHDSAAVVIRVHGVEDVARLHFEP